MSEKKLTPLIEEYEINPHTMIILPVTYGSKIYSQIWELEEEFISPFKPIDIIKKGCISFGSSYEGRKEATKQLIGITHKAPITIDSTNSIYFFPTASPNNAQCIWISQEHIHYHRREYPAQTQVLFKNKQFLTIPISYNSFNNQVLRTALLKTTLGKRIAHLERNDRYLIRGRNLNASERFGKYKTGKSE